MPSFEQEEEGHKDSANVHGNRNTAGAVNNNLDDDFDDTGIDNNKLVPIALVITLMSPSLISLVPWLLPSN